MAGRFKDEFDAKYSEDDEQEFLESPESKRNRLQYGSLDSTKIIERDLDSFPEEQKTKALERYKLLSLVSKELIGGWTPKNRNRSPR